MLVILFYILFSNVTGLSIAPSPVERDSEVDLVQLGEGGRDSLFRDQEDILFLVDEEGRVVRLGDVEVVLEVVEVVETSQSSSSNDESSTEVYAKTSLWTTDHSKKRQEFELPTEEERHTKNNLGKATSLTVDNRATVKYRLQSANLQIGSNKPKNVTKINSVKRGKIIKKKQNLPQKKDSHIKNKDKIKPSYKNFKTPKPKKVFKNNVSDKTGVKNKTNVKNMRKKRNNSSSSNNRENCKRTQVKQKVNENGKKHFSKKESNNCTTLVYTKSLNRNIPICDPNHGTVSLKNSDVAKPQYHSLLPGFYNLFKLLRSAEGSPAGGANFLDTSPLISEDGTRCTPPLDESPPQAVSTFNSSIVMVTSPNEDIIKEL